MFGKPISAYVRFAAPSLAIIAAVALLRWATALGWLSVTYVLLICALVWSVRVATTGFGGYRQILPVVWLQAMTASLVIIAAIVLSIFSGQDNVYTVPEFTRGTPGKTWGHAGGHLLAGALVLPLVLWGLGSLAMWVTKMISPGAGARKAA